MTGWRTEVLEQAVAGDIERQRAVESWTDDELRLAAESRQFTVRTDAVIRVVNGLLSGQISAHDAQRWASFVRRGYVASSPGRGTADVEIEYDPDYDEAIAEAVGRLDELGDIIDGELRPGEADQLLAALR